MKHVLLPPWKILKKTFINFYQDDTMSDASSIAFYTIFSMPAILIIALSIGSTFYERNIVQVELINQVSRLVGHDSAKEIDLILANAVMDKTNMVAKVGGVITLIFSATTVFISLQSSLNKIWGIKPKPKNGVIKFTLNRLLSLAMVASIGFLLLVSLVVDALLMLFQEMLSHVLEGAMLIILNVINIIISLGFITVMFGLLFKVLPDAKIKWKDVWVGSVVTMVLFTAGKFLIGFYLGNSSFNSAYGAAGSLVIILVWIYYSTTIFLFGAELTNVYTEASGRGIEPYRTAVRVHQIELEESRPINSAEPSTTPTASDEQGNR